jgi:hypothetical protein
MSAVTPEACPGLLVYVRIADGVAAYVGQVVEVNATSVHFDRSAHVRPLLCGADEEDAAAKLARLLEHERFKRHEAEDERIAAMGGETRERLRADKAETALASVRAYAETLTRAANSLLDGPERAKLEALWAEATRDAPTPTDDAARADRLSDELARVRGLLAEATDEIAELRYEAGGAM